jgi:NAD(P)-dependent dehydrogenase (short-subunit alcohol dehydrogenase family)
MSIILITGSNKGIGFETARQLGTKGHHVFISGRNEQRLNEALQKLLKENITADALLMDVSDPESIALAAELFAKQKLKLDVLINNAGIGVRNDRMISSDDEAVLGEVINTNAYGPLRVTKAFLPFMNSPARIINISSGGGSMTDPVGGWSPAYCVSKSLLNAITRHLANELLAKNISVNAVCPGWVRTDMGGKGASRTVQHGAETPTWLATEADQKLTGRFFRDKKVIPW